MPGIQEDTNTLAPTFERQLRTQSWMDSSCWASQNRRCLSHDAEADGHTLCEHPSVNVSRDAIASHVPAAATAAGRKERADWPSRRPKLSQGDRPDGAGRGFRDCGTPWRASGVTFHVKQYISRYRLCDTRVEAGIFSPGLGEGHELELSVAADGQRGWDGWLVDLVPWPANDQEKRRQHDRSRERSPSERATDESKCLTRFQVSAQHVPLPQIRSTRIGPEPTAQRHEDVAYCRTCEGWVESPPEVGGVDTDVCPTSLGV